MNCAIRTGEILSHIRGHNLRPIADSGGSVFVICDRYNGVWMEHLLDGVVWAELSGDGALAVCQLDLFFRHQKADGQLPIAVLDNRSGYGQIQECVSIGSLCLDALRLCPDEEKLADWYSGLTRWLQWQAAHRMTRGLGLIEMFCGYDTGHDNSCRLDGMAYHGRVCDDAAAYPEGCPVAPLIAPDMNAVYYGDHVAAADMSQRLGKEAEAALWREKAEDIRRRLFTLCYDPEDAFFYDVDKNGTMRRIKTVAITNVLHEGVAEEPLAREIFLRHLWNEREFKAPYPFPAVAMDEPGWQRPARENCWGYYSQALTALRATRWMPRYGLDEPLCELLTAWVTAWGRSETVHYGQELNPLTGTPSSASPWYSSCMLLHLAAEKILNT